MTKLILCFFAIEKKTPPLLSSIETTHLTVQTSWYPKETPSHFPFPFQINLKNFFFFPFRKTFFTYDIATILFFLAIEIKESYTRKTHGFGQPSNFSFRILSATLFGVTKNGNSLTVGTNEVFTAAAQLRCSCSVGL